MHQTKDHIQIFHKLTSILFKLMEKPEYTYIESGKLQDFFWNYFSEMIEIVFDLNVLPGKLEEISQEYEKDKDIKKLILFFSQTVENSQSYIVLNYFLYKFLKSYTDVLKEEYEEDFEHILAEEKITPDLLQGIVKEYNQLNRSMNELKTT